MAVADNFWAKVEKTEDCWFWLGSKNRLGYGHFVIRGICRQAHRAAYYLTHGSLPEAGLELDHLCRNPACVNPAHLEPVTHRENLRRSPQARQSHCRNGHRYTPENTYYLPEGSNGQRRCRTCAKENSARFKERHPDYVMPSRLSQMRGS